MKINYARLHSSTFVPGLGNVKETLDNTQFSKIDMEYSDGVLTVTASKATLVNKPPVTFLIPLPALAMMTSVAE